MTQLNTADAAGCDVIARAFNRSFAKRYATVMVGGADEPVYLPAAGTVPARVFFRADFAASALHEAAHWCIAGTVRRRLIDYGYRYQPPPRDAAARQDFFAAERDVQALERVFARCARVPFQISADDFATSVRERDVFAAAVGARADAIVRRGLPLRASIFAGALLRLFGELAPQAAVEPSG